MKEYKEFESGNKPFTSDAFLMALNNKEEKTGSEVAATKPTAPMSVPDKKAEKLPSVEEVESLETKLVAAVEATQKKEVYLKKISCCMADLVANAVRVNSMTNLEKEELMEDIRQNEKRIMENLAPQVLPDKNGRVPLTVWKARIAFAEAMIVSATTRNVLLDVIEGSKFYKLPDLIKLGVMEREENQNQKNAVLVEIFNWPYKINGSRAEAERIKHALETVVGRIKAAGAKYYAKLKEDLNKNASINNSLYIYAGTKGSAVLDVPTIEKGLRVSGGSMLVESNGENVWVVIAIGYFQKVMQEIADTGISIPLSSLKEERFGYKKGLSNEDNRRCQILHNMLRRAKTALDAQNARESHITETEKAEHEVIRKWVETEKAKTQQLTS